MPMYAWIDEAVQVPHEHAQSATGRDVGRDARPTAGT